MSNYQRIYIPGGMYFFTLVTYKRLSFLTSPHARKVLRESWRDVQGKFEFSLIALCLLPDHLHCIWKLPDNDSDYSTRWKMIESAFSININPAFLPHVKRSNSRIKKREAVVWQRRFWEHTIRDQSDLHRHIDYIHFNPVKHGCVSRAAEWPWSTFHRYLSLGVYGPDWGDISEKDRYSIRTAGE